MTLFTSWLFLILTPHTTQGAGRIVDTANAACRTNITLVTFGKVAWCLERIRLNDIDIARTEAETAAFIQEMDEFFRKNAELKRIEREAKRAEHAKQNPGG